MWQTPDMGNVKENQFILTLLAPSLQGTVHPKSEASRLEEHDSCLSEIVTDASRI